MHYELIDVALPPYVLCNHHAKYLNSCCFSVLLWQQTIFLRRTFAIILYASSTYLWFGMLHMCCIDTKPNKICWLFARQFDCCHCENDDNGLCCWCFFATKKMENGFWNGYAASRWLTCQFQNKIIRKLERNKIASAARQTERERERPWKTLEPNLLNSASANFFDWHQNLFI